VQALRQMKLFAASLLLVALAGFLVAVTVGDGHGGWGFLQTACEAALVGGLADWFAVTALFRRPLGLPIPHTAIIPRKKDQIGASLGAFVRQNFLTGEVVAAHVAALDAPRRAGEWLADPRRARRLAADAAGGLSAAAGMVRDEQIGRSIAGYAESQLRQVPAAPVLARVVEAAMAGGQHQLALTGLVRGLGEFLADNKEMLRVQLGDEMPGWVPNWVDKRVFARVYSGLQEFLAQVADDPDHELRRIVDARLAGYIEALRSDPEAIARAEHLKNQLIEHPAMREWTGSLWGSLKAALLDGAADPESGLQAALASLIAQGGSALASDPDLQARAERVLERTISQVLARYGDDVAAVIAATVERWDADETGRRLELQIGRDLQFIRVNGTVVGALVGLVIHAIAVLLG
jgi:uncharacterized membrane-anchored protein YjiN (DUF445 family)